MNLNSHAVRSADLPDPMEMVCLTYPHVYAARQLLWKQYCAASHSASFREQDPVIVKFLACLDLELLQKIVNLHA